MIDKIKISDKLLSMVLNHFEIEDGICSDGEIMSINNITTIIHYSQPCGCCNTSILYYEFQELMIEYITKHLGLSYNIFKDSEEIILTIDKYDDYIVKNTQEESIKLHLKIGEMFT